jgi:predicted Rossmann fold nucleotide-binding protein DprA/Smf involved in DNA uptake
MLPATTSIILGALYARGAPRSLDTPKRAWPEVVRSLRRISATLESAADALRLQGFWAEATVLQTGGLLSWAEAQHSGGHWLTAECPSYPRAWLQSLGDSAPPVLWLEGQMPPAPFLTIVGSRYVERPVLAFAAGCASTGVNLGRTIVSGGANGCDTAAANGCLRSGGNLIEIFPFGLNAPHQRRGTGLSVCAPDETFTRGSAMERNALLYAISTHSVVAHARFKQGGTWTGATDAHRRKLTQLLVRADGSQAAAALQALGALAISSPQELPALFQTGREQEQLRLA